MKVEARAFLGFLVPNCTRKNNLAKKWKKKLEVFPHKSSN